MSLFEIPVPPVRKRVKMEMSQNVVEDFESFLEFARTEEPHANADNILEYLITDFFGSGSLNDVREFRVWCAEQEDEDKDKEEEEAKTENLRPNIDLKADQTGEMSIPAPPPSSSSTRHIESRLSRSE